VSRLLDSILPRCEPAPEADPPSCPIRNDPLFAEMCDGMDDTADWSQQ
jgi:hypothetical protein